MNEASNDEWLCNRNSTSNTQCAKITGYPWKQFAFHGTLQKQEMQVITMHVTWRALHAWYQHYSHSNSLDNKTRPIDSASHSSCFNVGEKNEHNG